MIGVIAVTIIQFPHNRIVRTPKLVARLRAHEVPDLPLSVFAAFTCADDAKEGFSRLHQIVCNELDTKWCVQYLSQIAHCEVYQPGAAKVTRRCVSYPIIRTRSRLGFRACWMTLISHISASKEPDYLLALILEIADQRGWWRQATYPLDEVAYAKFFLEPEFKFARNSSPFRAFEIQLADSPDKECGGSQSGRCC